MKFAAIALIASVSAFDVNQTTEQLMETFDTRLSELISSDDFEVENMIDEAFEHVDMLTAIDSAFEHVDMLTAIDEAFEHVDMMTAIDEAFEHVDMMTAIDGAFEHVEMLTAIDEAFEHVDMMTAIDEAFEHVDMMTAIDEAFEHVDMLTAIDEAFDHVDMLSAIDEAFEHIDLMNTAEEGGNIDELLAALPSILADAEKINAETTELNQYTELKHRPNPHGNGSSAIIIAAGSLLAIGAGFVIKNKFFAVTKKTSETESLL